MSYKIADEPDKPKSCGCGKGHDISFNHETGTMTEYPSAGCQCGCEKKDYESRYEAMTAAAERAKEAAEAAKEEWQQKAAELDGVAKEATLTQSVQDIREDIAGIDIDTSDLAKQGTNPNATNTAILAAFGNIDFSTLAKQGSDPTATLTAIKELLSGGEDPDIPEGVAERLAAIMQFFNITEATEYTALTPAEAIAIARDCQYNVMGTDWPIPTWLPTGVTEAQVESAAEGLGIPYHEPTQTA